MTRKGVERALCLIWVTVALASGTGCLTTGVLERGQIPHFALGSIRSIENARLDAEAVYVTLNIQMRSDEQPRSVVLKAPLVLTSNAITSDDMPVAAVDGVMLNHLSGDLRWAGALSPEGATPLAIERVRTSDMEDAADAARALPLGVHVLDITYLPNVDSAGGFDAASGHPAVTGPVLGIVNVRDDGFADTLLLADIHVKTKHQRGWFLLTPFTVVGDIVASPVYFFMWLFSPHC